MPKPSNTGTIFGLLLTLIAAVSAHAQTTTAPMPRDNFFEKIIVEPYHAEGPGDLALRLWSPWAMRVHRSTGILVGTMGARWGFYVGAGEYTFRADFDNYANKLIRVGDRLSGSVEAKYLQASLGGRFNFTRWGSTHFYARAFFKPAWRTSYWSNATEEYQGFSTSSPQRRAGRDPSVPEFFILWRNGAGLTTFLTDDLHLNLEIAGETQVATAGSWEETNPFGVMGIAQGSLSFTF